MLSTEIAGYSDQIDQLAGEVATLRNREAIVVQAELARPGAAATREKARLDAAPRAARRSLNILRKRLVEIYKSDEPDALTVILESDGFDDLLNALRVPDADPGAGRRDRRPRPHAARRHPRHGRADRRAARDEIAAKKAELERTRIAARGPRGRARRGPRPARPRALDQVESDIERLEGDISDIQGQIQAQLAGRVRRRRRRRCPPARSRAAARRLDLAGQRPGRPRRSARAGAACTRASTSPSRPGPRSAPRRPAIVILAAPHQRLRQLHLHRPRRRALAPATPTSRATRPASAQSVSQGEVIGYVGCTGSCFGDHLHFEVRVNGAAVDPLGYL